MHPKKISIVIPTHNEEKNISLCLKSINKYAPEAEIILVDNYSTDKTVEFAAKYTRHIATVGGERSAQRNWGIKKAKGNYILFLDADMLLTPDTLQEGLLLIYKGKYLISFPEKAVGRSFWEKSVALERNLYQHEDLLSAPRLYPKKLLRKLGGFDKKLIAGEDWDLKLRAQKLGYKSIFTTQPLIHNESITSLGQFLGKKLNYIKNIDLYAKKHPQTFSKQASLSYRGSIFIKNWPKLLRDPLHATGFLFLKILIWYHWWRHER